MGKKNAGIPETEVTKAGDLPTRHFFSIIRHNKNHNQTRNGEVLQGARMSSMVFEHFINNMNKCL